MNKISVLQSKINAARQAVLSRLAAQPQPQPEPEHNSKAPPVASDTYFPPPAPAPTVSPDVIRHSDPAERFPSAAEVAGDALQGLSRGALRLWELLHATAVRVAVQRAYSPSVSHVVYQNPQRLLAGLLQVTERHTYRLVAELEAAGLIRARAWAAEVEGRNMWATTLFAVKTAVTDTPPRLTGDDFQHQHRDFASDLKRKNTVQHVMSHLQTVKETAEKVVIATNWAVSGIFDLTPVESRYDIAKSAVRDAVHSLGLLADCTPSELPKLVTQLGDWLAAAFHDQHSQRWYYSLLWSVAHSWEHIGALQARFMRVISDIDEYAHGIRNPRAWLNARVT